MERDTIWKGEGSYLDLLHSILNSLPPLSKQQTPEKPQNLLSLLRESHLPSDSAAVPRLRWPLQESTHKNGNTPENLLRRCKYVKEM